MLVGTGHCLDGLNLLGIHRDTFIRNYVAKELHGLLAKLALGHLGIQLTASSTAQGPHRRLGDGPPTYERRSSMSSK